MHAAYWPPSFAFAAFAARSRVASKLDLIISRRAGIWKDRTPKARLTAIISNCPGLGIRHETRPWDAAKSWFVEQGSAGELEMGMYP